MHAQDSARNDLNEIAFRSTGGATLREELKPHRDTPYSCVKSLTAVAHSNGGSEEQPTNLIHELTRKRFKGESIQY